MSRRRPVREPSDGLQAKLKRLPAAPGVYLHKDRAGKVIYVGKAKNLAARVRSYFQAGRDIWKNDRLVRSFATVEEARTWAREQKRLYER